MRDCPPRCPSSRDGAKSFEERECLSILSQHFGGKAGNKRGIAIHESMGKKIKFRFINKVGGQ